MSSRRRFRRRHQMRVRPSCEICGRLADGFLLNTPLCLECRGDVENAALRQLGLPTDDEGCGCPGCLGTVVIDLSDEAQG